MKTILVVMVVLVLSVMTPLARAAGTEKVLHNFYDQPYSGLIFDTAGNLYGTTYYGGTGKRCGGGCGTVYKLTPGASGRWNRTLLYSFLGHACRACVDGQNPTAGLIFDASGNLYGTTSLGGAHGYGTVFQLTRKAGGGWTEKILHDFNQDGTDGTYPYGGLVFDTVGNLYGTTFVGGANDNGTVFELTPGNSWSETVLYSFNQNGTDGFRPYAGLVFDAAGNLYGTTTNGGTGHYGDGGFGTVFELTPRGGGWTETILHNFDNGGTDGIWPYARLIFDASGNLYGTTSQGGSSSTSCGKYNCGTVFQLVPGGSGTWTENVLYSFRGKNGALPIASLVFGSAGTLYGTTPYGGTYNSGCVGSCGTVFGLTIGKNGQWAQTLLYKFPGDGKKGFSPGSSLTLDKKGNLYGTTQSGGAHPHGGVAFKVTP